MFTPNGKIYSKQTSGVDFDSGLRGLAGLHPDLNRAYYEDLLSRPPARTPPDPNVNYGDAHFDRRLPPQSTNNREYDEEQRKVHFRNGRRTVHGKDGRPRYSGTRNGNFDESSSVSSDQRYGDLSWIGKMPPGYPRTPQEYLRTPPEYKTPPDFTYTPEFKTPPEYKTPPEFTKKQPELGKSHSHGGHQSHSNQLLNLRSALNEKELELVELREQHITILNRATDARQNWEEALKSKDRVIMQLQKTLQYKKSQLDRQERENQENLHALQKKQHDERTTVEKQDLTIALLEAKNAQFVQELVEQQKLITRMKRHIDEAEKAGASEHQKLEMMNRRVQDLKAALQVKEEEANTQSKYCNELKTLLWKRDSIIAQLQLSEQQLQSNLAREVAAREALAMARDKVQDEKALIEKRLSEMQSQYKAAGNGASRSGQQKGNNEAETKKLVELKDSFNNVQESALKDLDDREGVMHRIQKRMRELQKSLRSKDNALSDKNNELQQAFQEIQRLTEEYESLKQEFEEVNKRNDELETTLAQLQDCTNEHTVDSLFDAPVEVLPYAFSLGGSTGEDLGIDEPMLDCMESLEHLSNASVYHANFEKVKIAEVEMPDCCSSRQQEQQQEWQQQEQQQDWGHQQQQQQQQPQQQADPESSTQTHINSKSPSPGTQIPPPPTAVTSPPVEPGLGAAAGLQRPSSPLAGLLLRDELDSTYNSIQDEIMKREQCWRKTEELMRAALTRRMKLLEEAKEVHSPETNVTWPAKTGLELHDRSAHVHNYHRRLQDETTARGNTEHRKQVDNRNSLDHHVPYRKVLREDGRKYHGPDCPRGPRQTFEPNVDHFKKVDDGNNRQPHEQGMILDRTKRADRVFHQESCKYSEHYGHFERNGHNRRNGRTQKGTFL